MEQSFVAWAKMRAHRLKQVKLGIGDDAALLSSAGQGTGHVETVVTTDSLLDGVHFLANEVDLRQIGRKLLLVNLSDLAAMAAEPEAFFVSLCLPNGEQVDAQAAEIFEGICEVAEEYGIAIAGGDTNCWNGPLALHGTAVGLIPEGQAWVRNGAIADDVIVVTGPLGGSILGKHLEFEPRFDVARKLRGSGLVHAAMDITDGLSIDLLRICDASHCGAILELEDVPCSSAAQQLASESGKSCVDHALGDGEDFELLLAVPPSALDRVRELLGSESVHPCGVFTSRTGLWYREGGKILQLSATGYSH